MKAISDKEQEYNYYRERERKNCELVECFVYCIELTIIVCGLISIYSSLKDLWEAVK